MTKQTRPAQTLLYILPVIFGVIILAVALLGGREYRLDEVWRLHAAIGRTPVETMGYIYQDVNPPLYPVLASMWLPLTGHSEAATHHVSALVLLLTLAFLARFVADLTDAQTAGWTVGLLGTLPVFTFYTHDAGPYTLYMLAWTATTFCFIRWLRTGRRVYSLGYVFFGAVGVYTQFFTVLIITAHITFALVFLRLSLRRAAFVVFMGAAVALTLFGGWGLVLAEKALSGQSNELLFAYFTTWSLDSVRVVVEGADAWVLLTLAVAGALVTLPQRETRPAIRGGYPRLTGYIGLTALVFFVGLFAVNTAVTRILTPRNLLLFLPVIALLAAVAVRRLGRPVAVAVGGLALLNLLWYPLWTFGDYFAARDVAAVLDDHIEAGAAVVVVQSTLTEFAFIPINYYLEERIEPRPQTIILSAPPPQDNNAVRNVPFPHLPDVRLSGGNTPAERARLLDSLTGHDSVWVIVFQQNLLGQALPDTLRDDFYRVREVIVPAGRTLVPSGEVMLTEYRRLPHNLSPRFIFGDRITLLGWTIDPLTVSPCDRVPVRSFWTASSTPDTNYSMNLSAVGDDGAVLATADGALSGTLTGLWEPETIYVDERVLIVPCEAQPGGYPLVLTIYDPVTVARLDAANADGNPVANVVYLTTLMVE